MRKRLFSFLSLIYFFLDPSFNLLLAVDLPSTPEQMTLSIGQQITLSKNNLNQISIANPQIAQARLTPDQSQIVITTLSEGTTDLIIWEKDGNKKVYPLRVLAGSAKEHALEIANLLSSLEHIRIKPLGNSIVIEGKAYRPDDLKRIQRIEKLYPNVNNLVELSDEVKPILTEEINKQLSQYGFFEVKAKIIGEHIYLTGEALNQERHQHALIIARSLYPNTQDMIRIGNAYQPMIRLGLTLMEISRSHVHALGIRWQDAVGGVGDTLVGTEGARFSITSLPIPELDIVERNGWGRILTQPKLVCQSGGEAEFHSGGEIPIRLVSERVADITYKKYGIILKMSPIITPKRHISLQINTEISSLDGGNSIEGIPALITRRLLTSVTVRSGENLVLGGLTDHNNLKTIQKIPGLGHIPILGELFKDRQFRNSDDELLIFIQPQIITQDMSIHSPQIRKMMKNYEESEKWFHYKLRD